MSKMKEVVSDISKLVEAKEEFIRAAITARNEQLEVHEKAIDEAIMQLKDLLNLDKYFPYLGADIEDFYKYNGVSQELCFKVNDFIYTSLYIYLEREDTRIVFGYDYRFEGEGDSERDYKEHTYSITFEDLCDDIQLLEDAVKTIDKYRDKYKQVIINKLG